MNDNLFASCSWQIGRSADSKIDFIVMDTVPGNKRDEVNQETQKSTISRYSCRIVVDRSPPHTARVFAAGFDKSSNIFLGVSGHNKVFSLKTR